MHQWGCQGQGQVYVHMAVSLASNTSALTTITIKMKEQQSCNGDDHGAYNIAQGVTMMPQPTPSHLHISSSIGLCFSIHSSPSTTPTNEMQCVDAFSG